MIEYTVIGKAEIGKSDELAESFLKACKKKKVIALTSERPHEGKSTTSQMLAESIGKSGKNVLLVDADMRAKGGNYRRAGIIHNRFEEKGFLDYARKVGAYTLVVPRVYGVPPEVVIKSEKFDEMLKTAKKEYDVVLVDLPPVYVESDAVNVCAKTDGVVVVRSSGNEHFGKVIEESGIENIIGVIETDARSGFIGGRRWQLSRA